MRSRRGPSGTRPLWTLLGLGVALVAWTWGSQVMGMLALPSPLLTLEALVRLLADGAALRALLETGGRVAAAFGLALVFGTTLGVLAGTWGAIRAAVGPLVRSLLAVPPIAWVVLALLWFGTGGTAVVFTVAIAILPVTFLAALRGTVTVDRDLDEMVDAFRLSAGQRLHHLVLPNLVSYMVPAAVTAFGLAWKVCVMAELLAARDGVGAGLAEARANLDTAEMFAWILMVVAAFLAVEAAVVRLADLKGGADAAAGQA